MKTTLSIIKADIGSIGGHIRPSEKLIAEVRNHVASKGKGAINDFFISHTGDDIAILFSHSLGKGSEKVHLSAGKDSQEQRCFLIANSNMVGSWTR